MKSSPSSGLYIVATPIGNLGDLSDRAKSLFALADLVACEDKRVTGKLLNHLGIKRPMVAYHDHSDDAARDALIARAASGIVVLVSDAGTPLISDPGYKLVRAARAAGITIATLPGPSAAIAALTLAGLPTDRFVFAGFLPNKTKARRDVAAEFAALRATLVFYETGPRLAASLADLADVLGPREAAVAREITKMHEECVTGTLPALADRYVDAPPKGEIVIVIAPPITAVAADLDDAALDALLTDLLSDMPVAKAAREAARNHGVERKRAYDRAVALKGGQ
ncbi:16S rRNA (cytidine(1402)-2'-O)-methyltransferase [Sphingorhabdus soli]|uniref:Ribosomal RNA small subunit methyltransferase I n=1 Tax=Flavisphingopyxis soli TaxID=2601267 RepID=A0A5C6U7S6_9SPHN|nr:16S rRNA (cytidine(1402)-2'-O)-methyltransferase [Sphingorhabdus soli]TXC68864.1 16S rRNA (cytidine(1402)-2'-O)-methyltransferase [Sphingorhabdus soli]